MTAPEPMPEVPGVRFQVDHTEITADEERAYRLRTRDELAKLRASTGAGKLIDMLQFGVLPDDLTRRNMDMFAAEVMPHLRH